MRVAGDNALIWLGLMMMTKFLYRRPKARAGVTAGVVPLASLLPPRRLQFQQKVFNCLFRERGCGADTTPKNRMTRPEQERRVLGRGGRPPDARTRRWTAEMPAHADRGLG
jgi:hypothetical protein